MTIAALLHLIRLMGAELVAGQHRDDVELLVKAIETKLKSVRLPAAIAETDIAAGMGLAQTLLAPIFSEFRERSEKAHLRDRLLSTPPSRLH
ncbi:hypothetical protein [Bradyrhizobium guangzhouense]|uniref:hypothetical protein n=1 Tax=Bradyrhizobium guangzhouense TaxID=1325095 RepID=UPI001FDEFEA1|nr:hypothetical protein [Bradyrhizobium guangzhouense]